MTKEHRTVAADPMEQAYDCLQTLEWSFAPLVILQAARETGLLRHLAATREGGTAPEIATALGLHPLATRKVLCALAALGLLEGEGDRFMLGAGFVPLFEEGSEVNHEAGLEHLAGVAQAWTRELPSFLRTGEWKRRARNPADVARFIGGMRSLAHGHLGRLAALVDLVSAHHLVDLGGALGTYSLELCLRHPSLRATVVDVPEVTLHTRDEIARLGLEDRVGVLSGSYHEVPLPEDADVMLLANVLHQETAETAAALLARAARALLPGGRVVVVDFTLEASRRTPWMGAVFAINMRLFGDTWTVEELSGWMRAAGLDPVTRHDLSPHKVVLVGTKP
jgi:hypothetical protein